MNFPEGTIISGKIKTIFVVISCLLICNCCLAQNIPVSLSVKKDSFEHLFKEITRQTGYMFFYDTETLQHTKPLSIHVKKMPLTNVLDLCFTGQPLSYILVDKMVIVKQKDLIVSKIVKTGRADLSGIVKDDQTGTPMQGVTVKLYNTEGNITAVSTDNNGHYSFTKIIPGNYKIVFNFIGYAKAEKDFVLVDGQRQVYDVVLQGVIGHLDDVVVIGYGQVRNGDLTGSVSSVSSKDIKDVPSMSFDDALAGKVPGLQVTKADGSPGGAVKVNIRGGVSLLGTNDPLYIIDGIPVSVNNQYIQTSASIINPTNLGNNNGYSNMLNGTYERGMDNLAGININDIESIDVLKDASSAAIYGSKAANGVVIITTKKGKLNTKPNINFNYYTGTNVAILPKLLNTEQYKEIINEALQNITALVPPQISIDTTVNTDWLKLVTRKGNTQNADFAVNGGGTASSYYASLSYTNEQGVLLSTGFKKVAGKINFEHNWSSRFRLLTNFNWGYTSNDISSGIYSQALIAPPDQSPYKADGTLTVFADPFQQGFQNPVALTHVINNGQQYLMLGKVTAEFDWSKNLKLRSSISINHNSYDQLQFIPSYVVFENSYQNTGFNAGISFGANAASSETDMLYENTATWNLNLKKGHQLNLLAGTSWETDKSSGFEAEGDGLQNDIPLHQLADSVNSKRLNEQTFGGTSNLLSFYIRTNYNYKHRYLFTFTGRADASSKFPSTNRVGYFPSAAFAWRISDEGFLKDQLWIDDIKLRVSSGKTGLNAINGDNFYNALYHNSQYAGSNAIISYQAANENLKWESVWQNDLGLDFALFKSRLNGTIAYYRKITDGLLLGTDAPPSTSSGLLISNTANIANRGIEISLQGDLIRADKFRWSMSFNGAHNISRVSHIEGASFSDPLYRSNAPLGTSIIEEGQPLGLIYGYHVDGILKTADEVTKYENAFSDVNLLNYYTNLGIGDYKYALNTSGVPKESVIGNGNPKLYGGITQNFTFKRFSLVASMTYAYGNQLLYQDDVINMEVMDLSNKGIAVLDRYTPQNTDANRPRLVIGQSVLISNRNVYDASYLKMRALTFNYTFPAGVIRSLNIKQLSLYVTGTNLFTLTRYPGQDPEVSDDPRSTIGGYADISSYPTTRSYIVGVRMGLN